MERRLLLIVSRLCAVRVSQKDLAVLLKLFSACEMDRVHVALCRHGGKLRSTSFTALHRDTLVFAGRGDQSFRIALGIE
ncbi:hypothetical protein D3C86_2099130 [compost metagenome]